jgi:hypothetical protein
MTAKTTTAQLLLCIPLDLKDKVQATADAEGVPVSAWAEQLFEVNVLPEEKTIVEQHEDARKLLPMLFKANREKRFLTYTDAVSALGWKLRGSARMMGDATGLVDAAAALANVPLIALYTVPANGGSIANTKAFSPNLHAQLLDEAKAHTFTQTDMANIEAELDMLFREGKGNKAAWRHIRETMPRFKDDPLEWAPPAADARDVD